LLNEVEQTCTRIAVLNQGKKVFDGSLAEAMCKQNWVRLRAGNFDAAVEKLRGAKLVNDTRDGKLISLAEGVGTDEIVRCLVAQNISVFEIAPQQETLEDFYLSLMKPEGN
jgi:ABC-2 type transport system ATP-binding protein